MGGEKAPVLGLTLVLSSYEPREYSLVVRFGMSMVGRMNKIVPRHAGHLFVNALVKLSQVLPTLFTFIYITRMGF